LDHLFLGRYFTFRRTCNRQCRSASAPPVAQDALGKNPATLFVGFWFVDFFTSFPPLVCSKKEYNTGYVMVGLSGVFYAQQVVFLSPPESPKKVVL